MPIPFQRCLRTTFAFTLVAALPACGGGGGGGGGGGSSGGGAFLPPVGNYTRTNPDYAAESSGNYGLASIRANAAQSAGWTGQGIKIGVVDTGIDLQHPDFSGAIDAASYDMNSGTRAGVDDIGGHGTMVAGVIAARRDGFDAQGVAPKSTILAVRSEIPGSCIPRCSFTYDALAGATNYAVANGARIINYSLGGGADPGGSFSQALRDAAAHSVILVSASGNDSAADPSFPGNFAASADARGLAIAVGAVDQNNNLASFSNKAGASANYFLVAPGVSIRTTQNGGGTTTASGTSFAAPHVAGAAALLMEASPFLTAQQIVQLLLTTATDLGTPGVDAVYGRGLVNVEAALQPQGSIVVPTGQNVSSGGVSLDASALQLGSAFGDALVNTRALEGAIFLDSYGRPFKASLGTRVTGASPAQPFESWLAPDFRSNNIQLPDGRGMLRYGLAPDSDLANPVAPGDSQERRRAMASLNFANGTNLSAGNGYSIVGQFGVTSADKTDPGLLPATARTLTPFLAMAGDGPSLSLGQSLGGGLSLKFGMQQSARDDHSLGLLAADRRAVVAELSKVFQSGVAVGLDVGGLSEKGGLLESRGEGAFGMDGTAETRFSTLFGSASLRDGFNLFGSWTFGSSRSGMTGDGILAGTQDVTAQAFRIGAAKSGLLAGGDQGSMAISRPLRVTGGTAAFDVPVGRTMQGDILYERRTATLKPSGNETDLEFGYRFALEGNQELLWNGLIQFEPGHVQGAPPGLGTGIRYRLLF